MKVICEYKEKCNNTTCPHRFRHELESICYSGRCLQAPDGTKCIPVDKDWDE